MPVSKLTLEPTTPGDESNTPFTCSWHASHPIPAQRFTVRTGIAKKIHTWKVFFSGTIYRYRELLDVCCVSRRREHGPTLRIHARMQMYAGYVCMHAVRTACLRSSGRNIKTNDRIVLTITCQKCTHACMLYTYTCTYVVFAHSFVI